MGTRLYGIAAAQNPDNIDETILIDGLDDTRCTILKDEHPDQESMFHTVGSVTLTKKIYSLKDCENEKQVRCWKHAQVPLLYAEAEIADDEDHPNAQSAAALLKFSKRPDIPLDVGFSIDGGIAERRDAAGNPTEDQEKGKTLTKTIAGAVSLTVKPCNPKCITFLEKDLTKSLMDMKPPEVYWEALKKSQATSSFTTSMSDLEVQLYFKTQKLKKSLSDYFGSFADMKCKRCGDGVRFFKSSSDIPNGCAKCGSHFSLTDIWNAVNK